LIICVLLASNGALRMLLFQALSAGYIAHPPRLGPDEGGGGGEVDGEVVGTGGVSRTAGLVATAAPPTALTANAW
jgi:hypothetical protein